MTAKIKVTNQGYYTGCYFSEPLYVPMYATDSVYPSILF